MLSARISRRTRKTRYAEPVSEAAGVRGEGILREDPQNDTSRCHAERSLRAKHPGDEAIRGEGILREDPQNDTG